jgi:tetratricopeptide (TPR) repeat protein
LNLGHAYKDLAKIRDLDEAERWYRRSVELRPEGDRQGRAQSSGQLGAVALERFKEACSAGRPEAELPKHLNAARESYQQALDLLPEDAVNDLAVTHNALGAVYANAGDMLRALPHYREAIRYFEAAGHNYNAGKVRFNVALALADSGRLPDAREYARAALRDFQTYGDAAAEMIERTQRVLAMIGEALGSG